MRTRSRVTQTIILAAGAGSRLASSNCVPKPLVTVGGLPLIARALTQAVAAGCREAIVVVGHEGARVQRAVLSLRHGLAVRFVSVGDASKPNGVSLLAAETLAASQFFLQMVDHVFSGLVLARLGAAALRADEAGRVLVDRTPRLIDLNDATKVRLHGCRVTAIGKNLQDWHAIDAGCFMLTPRIFDALRAAPDSEARTVSSGMRQLAARGLLHAVDIGGLSWVDIDTPAEHAWADGCPERWEISRARVQPPRPLRARVRSRRTSDLR
jgi:choline kinase